MTHSGASRVHGLEGLIVACGSARPDPADGGVVTYRFGVAAGGEHGRWHAVDLHSIAPPIVAAAGGGDSAGVVSVCGARSHYRGQLGRFDVGDQGLGRRRCESCGWVVALTQGAVEAQIELYTAAAGTLDDGLLRRIFVAILADLPPGRAARAGHRSELLAHAARHRPTVAVCANCTASDRSPAEVHGHDTAVCPDAVLVCRACTFTAGPWAGPRRGAPTGECVVAAPCSVLVALARHYDLPMHGPP